MVSSESKNFALKLTVDPDLRDKENICPAGTVKLFILTVVHSTASETSLREAIVPTHGEVAAEADVTMYQMNGSSAILILFVHKYSSCFSVHSAFIYTPKSPILIFPPQ